MFFIQEAHAQEAAAGQAGGGMIQLVMMVGLFAIIWFLMIRPQQKRVKEHRKMVEALGKGDEIMTGGGLMGRIVALDEQAVDLEIAKNTVVRIQRNFVTQVLPKGSIKASLSAPAASNDETVQD
ncbi:preprotein translocase subunit YajC [Cardiobacteriaceae bacterium TAE3-ERU3]|nr:preprotein translocase subunit YajC [Cardiobacteriaceae bacterium TAE3-ERU3]